MLTLQVQSPSLAQQLAELLEQRFNGNSEEMLKEFVQAYQMQLERLRFSGILQWEQDGLAYQQEIRLE